MADVTEKVMSFLADTQRNVDTDFVSIDALPGDDLTSAVTGFRRNIEVGHGLEQCGDNRIVCTHAGVLRYRAPATYYIEDTPRKSYYPRVGEQVVGIIEDRTGDSYKVNILSGCPALLSRMGFEGATKRHRPDLKKGDVVYCRVHLVDKDVDVELTCLSGAGVKKDWASGEAIYGGLIAGLVVRVPLAYAARLLHPQCTVLNALGARLSFEVAVGMNGVVWLRAGTANETIVVRNALVNAEHMDDVSVEAMCEMLVSRFAKPAAK